MLLMFGVGLHFSMADLMAVKRIAVPGAVVQIGVATLLGYALAQAWGWSAGGALVFGLALSVASTVVLLRALEARSQLDTPNGSIAVGWLVVEDLVMVLVLVLLPPLADLLAPASQSVTPGASKRPDAGRGPDAGQGGCLHRQHAAGGALAVPARALCGGAHRLARAVHAVRDCGGHQRGGGRTKLFDNVPSPSAPSSPG